MDKAKKNFITVVTISYQAEADIEKTLQSVLAQTYQQIEYIVKDGGSTDKTNEIIEQYKDLFHNRNISFYHIIKQDKGIYDAMNQATALATGEYIIYMNAGDIFWDSHVLTKIFKNKTYSADLLFGDSVCEYEFKKGKKEYTIWKGQNKSFLEMPFSHQACFFRTAVLKEHPYDLRFRSAADYHAICRLYVKKRKIQRVGCIVALCTMDGVSNTNILRSYRESVQIRKELGIAENNSSDTRLSMWLMGVKQSILRRFPKRVSGALLRLQMKIQGKRIYKSIKEIKKYIKRGETSGRKK